MARSLLLGRAGTGKTRTCLDRLVSALRSERRAVLVVPTYAQAEYVRAVLMGRLGAVTGRPVYAFTALAEWASGRRLTALSGDATRDRAAEAALHAVMGEAARRPGLRAEFLRTVKELKETGRPPADLVRAARAEFPEGSHSRSVFEAFERYVADESVFDHEDLLVAARDRIQNGKQPADLRGLDLLLVDGFHDFTPVQRQTLDALGEESADVVITLPLDPSGAEDVVFRTARRTAASFDRYRRVPLDVAHRFGHPALAHLEAQLFRAPGPTAPPPAQETVRAWACASEDDEADRIARFIAASARPAKDFLVVRRNLAGSEARFRAAFHRHGVPLRVFGREPLGTGPAGRAAARLLGFVAGNQDLRELEPLLRSPFLLEAPEAGELDRLAHDLREDGVLESLDPYPGVAAHVSRLEDESLPLVDLLRATLGLRDALVVTPEGSEEIARAGRVLRWLLGEAEVVADLDRSEAAARLLARLPLLRSQPRDRRHDCVYMVEARDARQWEKPVVFACGLGADAYPRRARQDLFLRDEERERFASDRDIPLPLRRLKDEEERYLFYVSLTRAREQLILSYVAFDEEGTPLSPSPYWTEALAQLDVPVRMVPLAEQYVQSHDAVSRHDLKAIAADGLSRLSAGIARGTEAALAVSLYEQQAVNRHELAYARRFPLERALPLRNLPVDPAASLSASSLNAYLRCPYLFLARRVHKVEPERPRLLDPMRAGNIVHTVLERLATEPAADVDALLAEVFEAETRGLQLGLAADAERRQMERALRHAADRLRARRVVAPEQGFRTPLPEEEPETRITGRIDRIDASPAGEIIRDYKYSSRRAGERLREVDTDLDLQLDVYLWARFRETGELPAGALFEGLKKEDFAGVLLDDAGDVEPGRAFIRLAPQALRERIEETERKLRELARRIRAGHFGLDPSDVERCTRMDCGAYDLCRIPKGRFAARKGAIRSKERRR